MMRDIKPSEDEVIHENDQTNWCDGVLWVCVFVSSVAEWACGFVRVSESGRTREVLLKCLRKCLSNEIESESESAKMRSISVLTFITFIHFGRPESWTKTACNPRLCSSEITTEKLLVSSGSHARIPAHSRQFWIFLSAYRKMIWYIEDRLKFTYFYKIQLIQLNF